MTSPTVAATGQWTPTGDLPAPRSWSGQHDSPVVLPGGKVLVAGGADGSSAPQATAALYDPAAGTWAATGGLHTARRLHTLTLLDDGKVLATGGINSPGQFPPGLASAEVYDPATGAWAVTGSLHTGRWGHSAVLLPDRRVLVAGGLTSRSGQSLRSLRSAEILDPATGTWTEVAAMTDARGGHSAIVLAGGRVLVVGGSVPTSRDGSAALAFCEVYDPAAGATGAWTPTGSLLVPRKGHQATLLSDGSVLATGGDAPGGQEDGTFDPFSRATAERYSPAAGTWSAVADMPAGRTFHRAVPRESGTALVIGGTDNRRNGGGYAGALIFEAGSWSPAGGMATGRWGFGAAVLADGRVLVTGGVTRSGLAAAGPDADEPTARTEILSIGAVIS
ncbi:Kelch repeat-containing protein [Streptomyces sp. FR-108]|uniref:Kelch repeat-containing protein n=1 Tax=Streptomyces sp. FR-108 TaxID=3416665 RepID=UPI003CE8C6A4